MIESLNEILYQDTKKIISATGKMMTLGLDYHELSNDDFECLSKRFKLNSLELEAEVEILKT